MEKGNLRNTPSKTNTSESKNKQDGYGKNNRFPRYKESLSPRPDTRRKPIPQKNRQVYDKRPRTRSNAVCEKYRNEVVVENLEASYCNPKQGSKKVNLNHLLNFTLTPIDGRDYSCHRPTRTRGKHPKYNKELFLQANCQFVTRDDGDYKLHSSNVDLLVDWALIEEIRLPIQEVPCCPICLYPPQAAKITRCGHIYCWACILHYLALTDRSWQKCPICFEAIHATDLKSVLPITQKPVTVNDKISMCLMKREKGSVFPVPAMMKKSLSSACRVNDDESVTRYQKLLLASKVEVQSIISRERKELEAQFAREKGETEVCFVESAIELLDERAKLLDSCGQTANFEGTYNEHHAASIASHEDSGITEVRVREVENEPLDFIFDAPDPNATIRKFHDIFDSIPESNADCEGVTEKINSDDSPDAFLNSEVNDIHKNSKATFHYFYQAEDGQHIYLHGLNVRMLVREYGSLEFSPPLLEAKVLALEKITMTEDLRKRLRYLQHIPLTCEFQVAELYLDDHLSKFTIQEFAGEVSKRKKMRCEKAREERKREKHIEIEEEKKLGRYPTATYNLNSSYQFPVCEKKQEIERSDQKCPHSESTSELKNEDYEVQYPCFGTSDLTLESKEKASSPPAASFAQMLRDGHNFSLSAEKSRKSSSRKNNSAAVQDADGEETGAVAEYSLSFGDVIQTALETAMINQSESLINGNSAVKSKKKKVKNKVLFTTSMCRSK